MGAVILLEGAEAAHTESRRPPLPRAVSSGSSNTVRTSTLLRPWEQSRPFVRLSQGRIIANFHGLMAAVAGSVGPSSEQV